MAEAVMNLIAQQYGPISDIELLWSMIAAVGLSFALWNVRDAWIDYKAMPAEVQNGRRSLAILGVKMEVCRVIIQAIFLMCGLLAMTLYAAENELTQPWRIVLIGAMFRWGFVVCGLLVMYMSYANYKVRRSLLNKPTFL